MKIYTREDVTAMWMIPGEKCGAQMKTNSVLTSFAITVLCRRFRFGK